MPLTPEQREILNERDEARHPVETAMHQDSKLIRMVRDWDAGQASFLIDEDVTDAQVIQAARAKLNAQRLVIQAAANAIKEI